MEEKPTYGKQNGLSYSLTPGKMGTAVFGPRLMVLPSALIKRLRPRAPGPPPAKKQHKGIINKEGPKPARALLFHAEGLPELEISFTEIY